MEAPGTSMRALPGYGGMTVAFNEYLIEQISKNLKDSYKISQRASLSSLAHKKIY